MKGLRLIGALTFAGLTIEILLRLGEYLLPSSPSWPLSAWQALITILVLANLKRLALTILTFINKK